MLFLLLFEALAILSSILRLKFLEAIFLFQHNKIVFRRENNAKWKIFTEKCLLISLFFNKCFMSNMKNQITGKKVNALVQENFWLTTPPRFDARFVSMPWNLEQWFIQCPIFRLKICKQSLNFMQNGILHTLATQPWLQQLKYEKYWNKIQRFSPNGRVKSKIEDCYLSHREKNLVTRNWFQLLVICTLTMLPLHSFCRNPKSAEHLKFDKSMNATTWHSNTFIGVKSLH